MRNGSHISRCFVITEYEALDLHSVRKAFDILYKSFHAFDLEYPQALQPVYSFFDLIYDESALSVSKNVREKYNLLKCWQIGVI